MALEISTRKGAIDNSRETRGYIYPQINKIILLLRRIVNRLQGKADKIKANSQNLRSGQTGQSSEKRTTNRNPQSTEQPNNTDKEYSKINRSLNTIIKKIKSEEDRKKLSDFGNFLKTGLAYLNNQLNQNDNQQSNHTEQKNAWILFYEQTYIPPVAERYFSWENNPKRIAYELFTLLQDNQHQIATKNLHGIETSPNTKEKTILKQILQKLLDTVNSKIKGQ